MNPTDPLLCSSCGTNVVSTLLQFLGDLAVGTVGYVCKSCGRRTDKPEFLGLLASNGIIPQDSWMIKCQLPQGMLAIPMTFFLQGETLRAATIINFNTPQQVALEGEVLFKEHSYDSVAWTIDTGAIAVTFFDVMRAKSEPMTGKLRIGSAATVFEWSAIKMSE